MGRNTLAAGIAVLVLGAAAAAEAQVSISMGGRNGGAIFTIGGGNPGYTPGYNPGYNPSPRRPRPYFPPRPSRPVVVTDRELIGYNPWTGQVYTENTQINNTAFDHAREQSKYNGTRRYVRRPVRDNWGNVTGYEEGWVWTNSLTGQEHGDLTQTRLNETGGTDTTHVLKSANPNAG